MKLALSIILLACVWANAAVYYVSPNGNDSDDGSLATPWATITNAAARASTAGDTVHVASGVYTNYVTLTHSGTEGSPISFWGPSDKSATNGGWYLDNAGYVTIGFFTVTNSKVATGVSDFNACGLWVEGHHSTIISNDIFGNGRQGILLANINHWATNGLIQGNRCWDNVDCGIFASANNIQVLQNEVWGTMATNAKCAVKSGIDGIHPFGANILVASNYVHGLEWVTRGADPAVHADGFQTWGYPNSGATSMRDSIIRDNIIDVPHVNGSGMMMQGMSNVLVYNNLIRGFGVVIDTMWDDPNVYSRCNRYFNNTFICQYLAEAAATGLTAAGVVMGFYSQGYGSEFTNNIFIRNTAAPLLYATTTGNATNLPVGSHNLFFYTGGAVGNQTGYTYDVTDLRDSSPLLPNAFSASDLALADIAPASGSPVIGAASVLTEFSTDILGNARGAAWDIGAYEYGSLPPPTTTRTLRAAHLHAGTIRGVAP